jgi:Domain of unknown function (DUF4347)
MLYLHSFSITNRHIVVIDRSVADRDRLIAGTLPQTTVLVLNHEAGGLHQILEVLHQHNEINSIHLVAHGDPGQIHLGQDTFGANNLTFFADEVKA